MADPRKASAERAGRRLPRETRLIGWLLGLIVWAVASDARPLLALISLAAAVLIRSVYVICTSWGKGRSVFWSAWFFPVAALCEVIWLGAGR